VELGIKIEGSVAPGFERVADAFVGNFANHGDVGAAVCVYRDAKPVVDLWAGTADPKTGRPWEHDTLQLVYSATKGVVATAAHILAERGDLDLDAPVASYWPEFADAGKADVPVRWLLTHQVGLPVLDKPVSLADALAWHPVTAALAAQAPIWAPGTAHGYHMQTFGWLVGEVIRRVTGRSPGQFAADEIAAPLGLDFFIGLPDSEHSRVSKLVFAPPPDLPRLVAAGVPEDMRDLVDAAMDPNSLMNRPTTDPVIDFNAPEVWRADAEPLCHRLPATHIVPAVRAAGFIRPPGSQRGAGLGRSRSRAGLRLRDELRHRRDSRRPSGEPGRRADVGAAGSECYRHRTRLRGSHDQHTAIQQSHFRRRWRDSLLRGSRAGAPRRGPRHTTKTRSRGR